MSLLRGCEIGCEIGYQSNVSEAHSEILAVPCRLVFLFFFLSTGVSHCETDVELILHKSNWEEKLRSSDNELVEGFRIILLNL